VLRRELLGAADAAMYAAKTSGGGRVSERGPETDQLGPSAYGALKGLVRAVDQKDRYTKAHSDQVASLAVALGRELGLPEPQLEALDMAGRLHDVGKIAVPDGILRKPGRLTDAERFAVEQHALFSVQMIQGVPHQDVVTAAVAHHHERWDGEGYPYGKRGEEIPLAGRILALADAFSAMTTDRPYRKGEAPAAAIAKIRTGAGTQFDPALIEPFVRALENLGEPLAATVAISQPDHPEESPAVAPMATRSRRRRRDFRPWPATSRRSVSLLRWRTMLHSGANRVASPVRMPKYATQRPPTHAADAVLSVQEPRPDPSPEPWSAIPDDVGAAQRP
jgi:putative nucleotidyltransferase with HDIG domain